MPETFITKDRLARERHKYLFVLHNTGHCRNEDTKKKGKRIFLCAVEQKYDWRTEGYDLMVTN
jgi:hypothetical protein